MALLKKSLNIEERFKEFIKDDINRVLKLMVIRNEDTIFLKQYDILLENGKTVECKCDERAKDTENFCIETHCNGNESGILMTSADYWLITDDIKCYLIKTSKLQQCIYDGYLSLFPEKPTKFLYMTNYPIKQKNGSQKLINFYTIPIHLLIEYCEEVANFGEMTYKNLL